MAQDFKLDKTDGPVSGQKVIRIRGPLNLPNIVAVQSALRDESASALLLDLQDVPYVDSAGLGSLVMSHVSLQKRGGRVALVGCNQRVKTVLEMSRLDTILKMFPTQDEAQQYLSESPNQIERSAPASTP